MTDTCGLLLVDKPKGWTSHDVVAALRRCFPRKTKVGHTGTLDPLASGLLILLIGRATKSAAHFQGLPKIYTGSIRLGVETASGDLDGETVTCPWHGWEYSVKTGHCVNNPSSHVKTYSTVVEEGEIKIEL